MASDFSQDESKLSIDPLSLEMLNQNDSSLPVSAVGSNYAENVALTPIDPKAQFEAENLHEVSLVPGEGLLEKKILSLENPKEMIARWKIDNLDLKTVVNDALLSGRLPLAVLQLHLHHSRDLIAEGEPHDIFNEVRDIGRAIAYDLFLKVTCQWLLHTKLFIFNHFSLHKTTGRNWTCCRNIAKAWRRC